MRMHWAVRGGVWLTCILAFAPVSASADDDGKTVRHRTEDPDRGGAAPLGKPAEPPRPVPWLTPNAQLQVWFTAWDQDEDPTADPAGYGDPELDTGFSIPRARFGFTGGWKQIDFNLRFGTSTPFDVVDRVTGNEVGLVDGWMRFRLHNPGGVTSIVVGQHTIPASREAQMSTNDIAFQERSVSTTYLWPVRDLGATLRHDWTYLGAAVGVFNGGGDLAGNDDNGVLVVTRLEGHVGGDTYRTNDTQAAFGMGASYAYEKSPADQIHRFGGDLLGRIKGITLFAEGGANIVDPEDDPVVLPPGVPEKTTRWGFTAQLSWYGETKLGAVEPAVRFSWYDDATHLDDNGDVGILHGGLTWREPVPFLDVGAVYIHRFEFEGRDIANDSVRVFAGVKYPSRRYAPADLVELFRRVGAKPLSRDGEAEEDDVDAGPARGRRGRGHRD